MIDKVFIVEISTDPFVKTAPKPIMYRFPSERKAMRFASLSIGQGHFATLHIEPLRPLEDDDDGV